MNYIDNYKYSVEPFKRESLENHPYFINNQSYQEYIKLQNSIILQKDLNSKCKDYCCQIL